MSRRPNEEQTTHFVWDGNVPLHEWTSSSDESNSIINDKGEKEFKRPEDLTTWIFEDGTFIPMAKLQGFKSYSIITDHLGTPTEAYDEEGKKVWSRKLGIYGQTRNEFGTENFIPFLYQGQYLDTETELAYNRHRYYDPNSGIYISQDPIQLAGGDNFYAFVKDINSWVDPFGLSDITVIRTDSNTGGNHYSLLYEDKKGNQMITDMIGGEGEITTVKNRPNTKLSLDDVADVDKKVLPITGDIDKALARVKKAFNNMPYDLGKIDCFKYVEKIIRIASPSAKISGADNLEKFKGLSCKK